ncbi:tRNA-dihydrouridine synthase 2-like protein [Tieghemostelium lacteum]|uniref:tRNA-dihydrouridine synthase 2-like protein n=1 Tax=Tieghemostelium lacteum TaxID=361077 RepID=A0A151ZAB7_TIELA|nr:tRNA-dihydrouridine synthase 2-like protein [Tieghemostelium lacteum]|eukprot:KYQ90885.1 tRNA-dihydrouridine synthase 2-like protein [Tieghemostelium lacteum]
MVRIGTLPMRLMTLDNGCDIAYSEELIDFKLSTCKRVYNEQYNTIDFVDKSGFVVYRTCESDRFNVLQIGTPSAVTALNAANVVVKDICALDINMGCPKHFSTQGNMGSKLLSKPETIKDILTTLVRNLPISVTCKIRLLEDDQKTIDLLKVIESCGVKAIGVHTRTIPERPRDSAHWDRLKNILENASFSVPIIANGSIFKHDDMERVKTETKASSIMVARGAIKNPSMFRNHSPGFKSIIQDYLRYSWKTCNHIKNSKYVICYILSENNAGNGPEFKQTQKAMDYESMFKLQKQQQQSKKKTRDELNDLNIDKNTDDNNNINNNNNNIDLDGGSDDEDAIERLRKKQCTVEPTAIINNPILPTNTITDASMITDVKAN